MGWDMGFRMLSRVDGVGLGGFVCQPGVCGVGLRVGRTTPGQAPNDSITWNGSLRCARFVVVVKLPLLVAFSLGARLLENM